MTTSITSMTRPRIAVISRTASVRDQFAAELTPRWDVRSYADADAAMAGIYYLRDLDAIILHAQGIPRGECGTTIWGFRQWVRRRLPGVPLIWLRRKGTRRPAGHDPIITLPIPAGLALRATCDLLGLASAPPLSPVSVAVDLHRHTATSGGHSVHLTRLEAFMLAYLQDHAGRAITPDELMAQVWQYTPHEANTLIRAHVSNLRNKLQTIGVAGHDAIETVRGEGYRWPEAASAEREAA